MVVVVVVVVVVVYLFVCCIIECDVKRPILLSAVINFYVVVGLSYLALLATFNLTSDVCVVAYFCSNC